DFRPGEALSEQPVAEVSVTISTRDRPDALARCLAALTRGSTLPAEVVVVDQSSDDEATRTVADEYAAFWDVVYVRDQPRGLAAAQNTALAAATRPIAANTDDDCLPDSEWIAVI